MSVRWPQNVPRPGVPTRSPKDEAPREQEKPGESKSGKASAKGGKAPAGGKGKPLSAESGGAQGAARQEGPDAGGQHGAADGMDAGGQRGAEALFPGAAPPGALSTQAARGATGVSARSGTGGPEAAQARGPQAPLEQQAPTVPADAKSEGDAAEADAENLARAALEGRARLRAAVLDRLHRGLTEVESRLGQFLENPGRQGVVTVPVVLSESSVTNEFWRMVAAASEDRDFLARTLGVPVTADDATLLQALRDEVHAAFLEFARWTEGAKARAAYDAVLARYEAARIQPVISGHDTGPLIEECARLQLSCEPDFTRSLLLSPLLLAVALAPEEGTPTQVMIAGLTLEQLGALVGHLRQLNPLLDNAQVRNLLLRAATDLKKALRKPLGDAEVERVQELARQLLRLQAVEMLFV